MQDNQGYREIKTENCTVRHPSMLRDKTIKVTMKETRGKALRKQGFSLLILYANMLSLVTILKKGRKKVNLSNKFHKKKEDLEKWQTKSILTGYWLLCLAYCWRLAIFSGIGQWYRQPMQTMTIAGTLLGKIHLLCPRQQAAITWMWMWHCPVNGRFQAGEQISA